MFPGIGILANVLGIIGGGLLGLGCGRLISERFQKTIMMSCAVAVIFLGLTGTVKEMLHIGSDGGLYRCHGRHRLYQRPSAQRPVGPVRQDRNRCCCCYDYDCDARQGMHFFRDFCWRFPGNHLPVSRLPRTHYDVCRPQESQRRRQYPDFLCRHEPLWAASRAHC